MESEFHRFVLDSAPFGAIVASTEVSGRCLYLNPEFSRITGYALEDIPTVADWLQRAYPNPEYRQQILDNWPNDTAPSPP